MPSKYVIRRYSENSYYHIFNRGVEKRIIFIDDDDYRKFLYYLFVYLSPLDQVLTQYPKLPANLKRNNLYGKIELICYCLMPNHFHLLVKQQEIDAAIKLLTYISVAYTVYFNKKYNRVGSLLQGRYKAILVETDEYLLELTRYIHHNSLRLGFNHNNLYLYHWSSYRHYLGLQPSNFLETSDVLNFFSKTNPHLTYKNFIESSNEYNIPETYFLDEE